MTDTTHCKRGTPACDDCETNQRLRDDVGRDGDVLLIDAWRAVKKALRRTEQIAGMRAEHGGELTDTIGRADEAMTEAADRIVEALAIVQRVCPERSASIEAELSRDH